MRTKRFFHGRSWGRTLAGGLLLIAGLLCTTFILVYIARDASLWVFGRSVTGEVLEPWLERTSEQGAQELTFRYHVRYQFTAPGGKVLDGDSTVSGIEWSGLGEGSPITVLYFPLYPGHNRLDDSRYIAVLACAYVPFMLLSLVVLTAGWRLMRSASGGQGEDAVSWRWRSDVA